MLRCPMLFLSFDHPLIEAWLERRLAASRLTTSCDAAPSAVPDLGRQPDASLRILMPVHAHAVGAMPLARRSRLTFLDLPDLGPNASARSMRSPRARGADDPGTALTRG